MPTILFEQIDGGETETPMPETVGEGVLRLRGFGYSAVSGAMGSGMLHLRTATADELSEALEPPSLSIGEGTLVLLAGYSLMPVVNAPAEGDGALRITGMFASGTSGYSTDSIGDALLSLSGYGAALSVEVGEEGPAPPPYEAVFLSDTVDVGDSMSSLLTLLLRSRLRFQETARAQWDTRAELRDSLLLAENLEAVYHVLLVDSAEFSEDVAVNHIVLARLHDVMLLSGVCTSLLEAHALLTEAIAFGDMLGAAEMLTLADAMELADSVAQSYHGAAVLVDALQFEDTLDGSVTFTVLLEDAMALTEAPVVTMELSALLRDGISFVARLAADNQRHIAWSMNTENKALTTFSNYPFNSFFTLNGATYGVSETGLYRLGGDTDNEDPITARLRVGMTDLGSRRVKNTPSMYLGLTTSGEMYLKVIVASETDGAREAHVYRLNARNAASLREGRSKIGRGLDAVYFDYELENIDGADFSLDVTEVLVVQSSRQIRGNAGKA